MYIHTGMVYVYTVWCMCIPYLLVGDMVLLVVLSYVYTVINKKIMPLGRGLRRLGG